MRAIPALAAGLLALATLTPPAAATAWQPYTALPAGADCAITESLHCPTITSSKVQYGPFTAGHADIIISDQSRQNVGGAYAFYDAGGTRLASHGFCARATNVPVPTDARYLTVTVDNAATPQHCGLVSPTTLGFVGLTLRR